MADSRNRAFLAKLFAAVSAIKASYAELQTAQRPYNDAAVQSADQAVVDELKTLSELKRRFMKKQLGSSSPPHVTAMLAEIQEQQSLIRIYEIAMRKMRDEIEDKERKLSSMKEHVKGIVQDNMSLEKKMKSSGSFSIFDRIGVFDLRPKDFTLVLQYALRSVRNFVKLLIREMESANWDIDAAANAIHPGVVHGERCRRAFVFESFVCGEMLDGFNDPGFSISENDHLFPRENDQRRRFFFEQFKRLSSANAVQFLKRNPNSPFGDFLKSKYLQFVHPKMEFSFSGDLNQRKKVSAGECPETDFFKVFAEMSRRVWLLHCLAFSFEHEVVIFQVKKNARFSEVYMQSVSDDTFATAAAAAGELRVAFTVVPGFKFRRTVIQSQVYLFPAKVSG